MQISVGWHRDHVCVALHEVFVSKMMNQRKMKADICKDGDIKVAGNVEVRVDGGALDDPVGAALEITPMSLCTVHPSRSGSEIDRSIDRLLDESDVDISDKAELSFRRELQLANDNRCWCSCVGFLPYLHHATSVGQGTLRWRSCAVLPAKAAKR